MIDNFSAVAILSGAIIKDSAGRWRTTTFADQGDEYGALGDSLRVLAATVLYKKNPKLVFILFGGKGQLGKFPGIPAMAGVIKSELMELGVPKKKIFIAGNSNTTFESLINLKKIIEEKNHQKIIIISNRYNLPRVRMMIKKTPELAVFYQSRQIKLAAAEKILIEHQPSLWRDKIKIAYQTSAMKKRQELERKGTKDFATGKYVFHHYEH